MVFWFLLKFIPVFMSLGNVPGSLRYALYGACGLAIAGTVIYGMLNGFISLRPSGLGFLALALFVGSFFPTAFETFQQPVLSESLSTLRGTFLLLSMWLLIQKARNPNKILWAFFGACSLV